MKSVNPEMKKIRDEVMACRKCPLYNSRIYPVVGEGSHEAKIMFVGEAPGRRESETGRPFCGAAGKILDELLMSINLKREDIYIANILKDRPPSNRDPQKEEIEACAPFLERQIETIKPEVVCALGNYATRYIMEKYGLKEKIEGISRIRGQVFEAKTLFGSIKIIPLYHPAMATYNPNMKEVLKEDFKVLKKTCFYTF